MIRSDWYKRWSDTARFAKAPFPGITLDALKYLHLERKILFHGHEPLDTDTTPTLEGEYWLMHNQFTQAEGVATLDQVQEAGALLAIGSAKPEGGTAERTGLVQGKGGSESGETGGRRTIKKT